MWRKTQLKMYNMNFSSITIMIYLSNVSSLFYGTYRVWHIIILELLFKYDGNTNQYVCSVTIINNMGPI